MSLIQGKRKYNILSLIAEDGHAVSKTIAKHLGITIPAVKSRLKYYVSRGWLKPFDAVLNPKEPDKRVHYIVDYELTDDGRMELQRLRRMYG